MASTETLDKLYLEWSQFTEARTEREIARQERIDELIERLEKAEALLKTSDTEKLRTLRLDLARIAEKGKQANRGQLLKWVKIARTASD